MGNDETQVQAPPTSAARVTRDPGHTADCTTEPCDGHPHPNGMLYCNPAEGLLEILWPRPTDDR